MAVEKMHFVSMAGPIEQLERLMLDSISALGMQLVDVVSILDEGYEVKSFNDINPYDTLLKKMDELFAYKQYQGKLTQNNTQDQFTFDLVQDEVKKHEIAITGFHKELHRLNDELAKKEQIRKQIIPVQNLLIEIDKLFNFKFTKFRFGRMPKDNFVKVQSFIESLPVLPLNVLTEGEFSYLIYFTPEVHEEEVDQIFKSLSFERIRISDEVNGYPKDAIIKMEQEIVALKNQIILLDEEFSNYYIQNEVAMMDLYSFLAHMNRIFEGQKSFVHTKSAFFIAGWIPDSHLSFIEKHIDPYIGVSYTIEEPETIEKCSPPTKLKNSKVLKPFEDLVFLYGVPHYKEIDPTPLVAITYIIMFGIMFGDLGQGLIIAGIGAYAYFKKGIKMAKILMYLGGMSAIAGVFYGSLFGNETFLREVLPFVPMINSLEHMNEVLLVSVVLGIGLILMAMTMNMINLFRFKKIGKMLFDRNGLAGLIFYMSCLIMGLFALTNIKVSMLLVVVLIILPLVIIFFAHPLENLLKREKHFLPNDKVGFFVESVFELFETVLAFVSNTVSFIRVGAFALNHVGFFMAFHMLGKMVGGTGNIVVIIFGNILVIALEGLIVGIQGLRLEYYELFSRFFNGEGVEFKPFDING